MQRSLALSVACLLLVGCGDGGGAASRSVGLGEARTQQTTPNAGMMGRLSIDRGEIAAEDVMFGEMVALAGGVQGDAGKEDAPADQPVAGRKIIYTAQVSLVVEDFAETESQIRELIKRFSGYVSESHVDRTQGDHRSGRWVVRIPVARFDAFLAATADLGVPENSSSAAQDVTEEFVDLDARIKTKKEVERRIIKLLEDRSGDIKDVIAVESELGRVREEIERMEGRLRYMKDRTALTTVTINAREERDYVPPQAPAFTAQIGQTWTGSVDALTKSGKAMTLTVVAITPWLPVLAVPVVLLFWLVRRRLKMV